MATGPDTDSTLAGGFTPKRRVYVLHFDDDPELSGLQVRARSASIGTILQLGQLAGQVKDSDLSGENANPETVASAMDVLRQIVSVYAGVLVSWNMLDDHGAPVPATVEGMHSLDPAHLMRIIRTWQQVVSQAPADLGKASSGGAPSVADSLTMEPLSPNPPSMRMPA